MDVFGKNPTSKMGEYFRRNVWHWRRLADLVVLFEPQLASKCKYWHTNDGAGLSKRDAGLMADRLDAWVESGRVKEHIDKEDAAIAALPRVTCPWCNGIGIRTDEVGTELGMPDKIVEANPDDPDSLKNPRLGLKGWCNACDGWGSAQDPATMYWVTVDDVVAFAAFMRDSGGFQIC
jgi:hypothetical protein